MASETLSEEVAGNVCDWCQGTCDPAVQELNALTCSFTECPETSMSYHQTCLEKYLKSIKLDKCVVPLDINFVPSVRALGTRPPRSPAGTVARRDMNHAAPAQSLPRDH